MCPASKLDSRVQYTNIKLENSIVSPTSPVVNYEFWGKFDFDKESMLCSFSESVMTKNSDAVSGFLVNQEI